MQPHGLKGFVGYTFDLPIRQSALYVTPQIGLAKTLTDQPWPAASTGVEFIPNILVGINF